MVVIKRKRKILGREKDNIGVLIKGAKVIPTTQAIIDAANRELRKKCAIQRENDAEATIAASKMWVGSSFYEPEGCYFEKHPEEQIIYGGPVKTLKLSIDG